MSQVGKKVLYQLPYPYFFSQHNGVGGHVAHALGVVEGFIERGFEVVVIAHEGKELFERIGASFIQVEADGNSQYNRQRWLEKFFSIRKNELCSGQYHTSYTRYSASATPWFLMRKRFKGVIEILEVNSFGSQRVRLLQPFDKMILSTYDSIVLVSEDLKMFANSVLGYNDNKLKVVRNGVSESRFRFKDRNHPKLNQKSVSIAYGGLIEYNYGLENIIKVAKMTSQEGLPFRFNVFGAGPFLNDMINLSKGLSNIQFHGAIKFHDMPDILSDNDILLYSTDHKNSFQSPIKIFEYLALGRPVVSARTTQTEVLLTGLQSRQFYNIGDIEGILNAIKFVVDNYDQCVDEATELQKYTKEKHTWRSRVGEIVGE